jgi:glycerol-3-phosphate acyltransferase
MPISAMLGIYIRVKGAPPLPLPAGNKQGILFVSSHRTLLDPTYMCVGLRRKVRALAYSVSWVSEVISPIKTASLTRDREEDRRLIAELLEKEEDLFVCPEGTTCREPYLLRFSPLFAELTEHIVPVGMRLREGMFHGSSARGYKALDPFFYLMNPRPEYEILFLERLAEEETVLKGGKTGVEVARLVQKRLADALGFTCTELTRKDKYMVLAGNDGTVKDKRFTPRASASKPSVKSAG